LQKRTRFRAKKVRILGKKAPLFELRRGYIWASAHYLGRQKLSGSRLGRAGSADLFFRSAAFGLARLNSLLGTALVKLPMVEVVAAVPAPAKEPPQRRSVF
jgi:hypothetical protein